MYRFILEICRFSECAGRPGNESYSVNGISKANESDISACPRRVRGVIICGLNFYKENHKAIEDRVLKIA